MSQLVTRMLMRLNVGIKEPNALSGSLEPSKSSPPVDGPHPVQKKKKKKKKKSSTQQQKTASSNKKPSNVRLPFRKQTVQYIPKATNTERPPEVKMVLSVKT